jgi:hypothetical protein
MGVLKSHVPSNYQAEFRAALSVRRNATEAAPQAFRLHDPDTNRPLDGLIEPSQTPVSKA